LGEKKLAHNLRLQKNNIRPIHLLLANPYL